MNYVLKVTLEQLDAAKESVRMAANMSERGCAEIDFYCPNETRFLADTAALLQRFLHQIEEVAPDGVPLDDLYLEFDARERSTFLEILHTEITINGDIIETESSSRNCPLSLRLLAHQLDLWDIVSEAAA